MLNSKFLFFPPYLIKGAKSLNLLQMLLKIRFVKVHILHKSEVSQIT